VLPIVSYVFCLDKDTPSLTNLLLEIIKEKYDLS